VDKSAGHLFHNRLFKEKAISCRLCQTQASKRGAGRVFSMLEHVPFNGFSVTMPLKEGRDALF